MKRLSVLLLPLLVLLTLPLACDSTEEGLGGRVVVKMTDDPLQEIVEAHVTITRVELIPEDEAPVVLSEDVESFDLVTLQNGLTTTLADEVVPPGTYHQLRIVIEPEAEVVLSDASSMRLKVPSGSQTGIKILLPAIVMDDESDDVEITFDFDLTGSFVRAGNSGKYIFKPVLKPLEVLKNGEPVALPEEEPETEED